MSLRLFIFSIILFLFECPYQHGKVDWLALCKCFILLKTNIAKQGGTKMLTFSDNSEARLFCTTQLLKVNFPFRSFLSSISPYRAHHSLKPYCSPTTQFARPKRMFKIGRASSRERVHI